MELIRFKEIFEGLYQAPSRTPAVGHYNNMVYGFIMLLFIGFNRVWHFSVYPDRLDVMFDISCGKTSICCDILAIVNSLGINQGKSLLEVMSAMRERVWHLCEIEYRAIHTDSAKIFFMKSRIQLCIRLWVDFNTAQLLALFRLVRVRKGKEIDGIKPTHPSTPSF